MASSTYVHPAVVCGFALALIGCGDDGTTTAGASMSTTSVTGVEPTTGTGTATMGTPTTSVGDGTMSASGTSSGTDDTSATQTGPGTLTGTQTSDGTDSASTAGPSTSTGTTEGVDDSGTSMGTMTGPGMDLPEENCEVKCGNSDWSYVYIANTGGYTLSKLDTRTMTEVGRYPTRPDNNGNPSRTSVSIDGKAVVVANRSGGITKVWARPEYCEDKNGNGMIDTSTGKNDVKAFDAEECIAWYTPFPGASTQRPVAWTSGVYNTTTCEYDDQKVWTAASYGQNLGCDGSDGIYVYRLNGDTGAVEEEVHLPDVNCGLLGAYGAAVDAENNAWFYVFGGGVVFKVDYDTLAYTVVPGGSYGITVDTKSRVWIDTGQRYDPVAGTWANPIGNFPTAGGSGVVQDLQGRIWNGRSGQVGWLDADTMVVGDVVNLPENTLMRGIGVDVDGFIWAVPLSGTHAYRIHPDTYEVVSYDGLNNPYTYSDMAGGQINNVVCPQ